MGWKDTADSTHGPAGEIDIGTVVAEETPVWYSPQPDTELQLPERVYPDPAVYVVEVVSVFPITTEPVAGEIDGTEVPVWLVLDAPTEARSPVAVTPLISYIETEPATVEPKVAVMVSAALLFALAYQM